MKNIHILPTDKPSRLYYKDDNYKLANSTMAIDWYISSAGYKPTNIYITSDEEIKEDDWIGYLNLKKWVPVKYLGGDLIGSEKKIILTTDQDLIAGGVQAIDDEFLEWFVKNPSCEFVDVKKQYITPLGDVVDFCYDNERLNYKIIIPQEELNPFELPKALPDDVFYQSLEAKQETLEDDAKYQAERMYSEEDLREAFRQGENNVGYNSKYGYIFKLTEKEWFEQFSKLKNG
jgi:hypothetical protein